jgi:hypothetical protein
MPVEFLSQDQHRRYGRYADHPSPRQLARYFHLDDRDRQVIARHRADHNRLGFAVQLGTVRFLGTFLPDPTAVPCSCGQPSRSSARHPGPELSGSLRQATDTLGPCRRDQAGYGYRDFHDPNEMFRLLRWLYTRAWLSSERPSVLFDHATARLVERKVLLPGVTVMERLVACVRERAAARLWRLLAQVPGDIHKTKLEALLQAPPEARPSPLDQLRRAPVRVSAPALVEALQRLEAMRALGVADLPLDHVPPSRLRALARHGAAARAQTIARMAPERRVATLLAFARAFEIIAMDDAIDLLDFLISQLIHEARNEGERQRLRTLRDLDAAALQLWNAIGVLLDETVDAAAVRTQTYARFPRQRLLEAGAQVETLARPADGRY